MDKKAFNYDLLIKVLRETEKTDIVSARWILREAYETSHHIHDHLRHEANERLSVNPHGKRPLGSIAMHDAEDYITHSRMNQLFDIFLDKNVHQATGMSWPEFLQLPNDMVQHILKQCGEKVIRDANANNAGLEAFKNLGKSS